MKKGSKKLSIFLSTTFFLISCVFFFYVFREIDNTKRSTKKLEEKLQEEYIKRNEMKTLDKSLKFIEEEKLKLDTHFSKASDIVSFLNTLEKIAKDAGTSVKVSSVDISKENNVLSISLRSEGSFGSVYKLLQLLENSPYELDITAFDIQKIIGGEGKGSSWEGIFRLRLISFLP